MASHRIHMLLDRSGSMDSYRQQTIEAVNSYLASLRADALATDTSFTLTTFDSQSIDTVRRDEPAARVRDLQASEFQPRAATPLYDAIGHVVDMEREIRVSGRRAIVLITDGEENGSRRATADRVKEIVTAQEGQGWIFIFLGANQDAGVQAAKVGVPEQRAIAYRARSGVSAGKAFAAAAALSFAYFTLVPGASAAAMSALGFSEGDRQAAFDGAKDWQAEMEKDISGAPSEPAASDAPNEWGSSGTAGTSGGSDSGGTDTASATPADTGSKDTGHADTNASLDDNEPTPVDAGDGEEGGILGSIMSGIGSLFSVFGGDSDSSDSSDSGGSDSGGD